MNTPISLETGKLELELTCPYCGTMHYPTVRICDVMLGEAYTPSVKCSCNGKIEIELVCDVTVKAELKVPRYGFSIVKPAENQLALL